MAASFEFSLSYYGISSNSTDLGDTGVYMRKFIPHVSYGCMFFDLNRVYNGLMKCLNP